MATRKQSVVKGKAFILAKLVVIVSVLYCGALSQDRSNVETTTIKGTVVAEYNSLTPCGWHVCGLSLVVRLDKQKPDTYAVVHVEYMDNHSLPKHGKPSELVQRATRWKFLATSEGLQPLQKYWNIIEGGRDVSNEAKIEAWLLLKDAKTEALPFGLPIQNYRVRVGKFKKIG